MKEINAAKRLAKNTVTLVTELGTKGKADLKVRIALFKQIVDLIAKLFESARTAWNHTQIVEAVVDVLIKDVVKERKFEDPDEHSLRLDVLRKKIHKAIDQAGLEKTDLNDRLRRLFGDDSPEPPQ